MGMEVRDKRGYHISRIPNEILDDESLTAMEKMTLISVLFFVDNNRPLTAEALSRTVGCDAGEVVNAVKSITEKLAIKIEVL